MSYLECLPLFTPDIASIDRIKTFFSRNAVSLSFRLAATYGNLGIDTTTYTVPHGDRTLALDLDPIDNPIFLFVHFRGGAPESEVKLRTVGPCAAQPILATRAKQGSNACIQSGTRYIGFLIWATSEGPGNRVEIELC